MLSIDDLRALSEVDPEFKQILESDDPLIAGWTHDTDIFAIRRAIAKMRREQVKPDKANLPYCEEDIEIPVRDGRVTAARVYRPRAMLLEGCPGMVIFHGGGYLVGDFETEAWLCALFVELGGIAVNVDYRHAPEHVFPAAIHDALDSTVWISRNAKALGINPRKGLLVGGESSGADMALVVAHLCRDSNMMPPLTGIYAPMPGGATKETVPAKYRDRFISLEQNARAPMLWAESIEFFRKLYKADLTSPLALPIVFGHAGLPKTYFQVCGLDPVRDCGLIMEQTLREAGVETKMDMYPGLPHAFWGFFPQLTATAKHGRDSEAGLRWLLEQ
ncbi:lipase 2 [Purpureocillium lavendulum]|uniref:Lipase 2 n=1 Tax=Purpureocillium lavendulum TaxID=1247861 RepID=A0AB34G3E7_9HYPO|nr:lipase 2 [Purpureocillium lavendulum]